MNDEEKIRIIQLLLTPYQLNLLKEALDTYLDGFSPEDDEEAYTEASLLRDFMTIKLSREQPTNEQ
jgi:hypothetical protein